MVSRKTLARVFVVLCLFVFAFQLPDLAQQCGNGGGNPTPPAGGLANTFFSMTMNQFGGSHISTIPSGSMRAWDTSAVWPIMNTAPGVFNFANLLTFLNQAKGLGHKDAIFTLGRTPSWAVSGGCSGTYSGGSPPNKSCKEPPGDVDSGDTTLKTFATKLAQACVNDFPTTGVKCIFEGWNEPDINFGGTMAQLVTMQKDYFNAVKAVDPSFIVTGPAPSTGNKFGIHTLPSFYSAGGATWQDVVAMHGYIYDGSNFAVNPEGGSGASGSTQTMIDQLRSLMSLNHIGSKPIWITEVAWGGSPTNTSLSDQQKREYFARDMMYYFMNEIARVYWYAWDNINWGTLFNGSLTGTGVAFREMNTWLTGSTHNPGPCQQAADKTWTCTLVLANKASAQIMFNPSTTVSKSVSALFHNQQGITGPTKTPISGQTVSVGPAPIMLTP